MKKNILFIVLSLLLVSCKYEESFKQLSELEAKKILVEEVLAVDLTEDGQLKIKDYFSTIKVLAYEIKDNKKMSKYLHRKFSEYYKQDFCSKSILDSEIHRLLVEKCTVSGFYICSEEMKAYKDILKSVKSVFSSEELEIIIKDQNCREKLINLGVLNE